MFSIFVTKSHNNLCAFFYWMRSLTIASYLFLNLWSSKKIKTLLKSAVEGVLIIDIHVEYINFNINILGKSLFIVLETNFRGQKTPQVVVAGGNKS